MALPEEILKKSREAKGLSQEQLAKKAGVTERMIQRYEAGEFPKFKKEKIQNIDKILGTNLHDIIYDINYVRERKPLVKEEKPRYEAANHSETAILNLTESNRMLAEAQLKIADSNQQLTFMVKGAIEGRPQGNLEDLAARVERLASLVGLVGAGKRFASRQEAVETIDIILSGQPLKSEQKGKRVVSGKVGI